MVNEIVRKPTKDDVEYIINHIRPEDVEEVDAFSGETIRNVLETTPDLLNKSQVWEVDGRVVCIFGVNPINDMKMGIIWMLATTEFEKYSRMFAVRCKKVVDEMIDGFDFVLNYVHSKNKKSIEWLSWLGFKIYEPEPVGHKGELFTRFEMRKCAIQ